MKVVVIGTGYVGLVSGVCLASIGHTVTCIDNDIEKIEKLNAGQVIIYEPGLCELIESCKKRISFTTDLKSVVNDSDLVMIAVGTPQGNNGSSDLTYIKEAARDLARAATKDLYVVVKSTVPVGTCDIMYNVIAPLLSEGVRIFLSSNPEFLREGTAIKDFLNPDRIVIGTDDDTSRDKLFELYEVFIKSNCPVISTDVKTAQLIKYASNSFIATKISFINALSNYCEAVGANIEDVALGMGYDPRIGNQYLKAGIGFGGSCFPKDVASLKYESDVEGVPNKILDATLETNEEAKMWPIKKLFSICGEDSDVTVSDPFEFTSFKNSKIAILGLAFKPETDDVRCSPGMKLLEGLSRLYEVTAYDPIAIPNAKKAIAVSKKANISNIKFCDTLLDAVTGVDIVIFCTEWAEFKKMSTLTMSKMKTMMRGNIVLDGRNIFNPKKFKEMFSYYSVGRL